MKRSSCDSATVSRSPATLKCTLRPRQTAPAGPVAQGRPRCYSRPCPVFAPAAGKTRQGWARAIENWAAKNWVTNNNDGEMLMLGFKRASLTVALAAVAALAARPAGAQGDVNYPTKPIRFIVGFAAGGGNDLFARLVGQKLSENIGQPVIIENKPGAGGRLAVDYALNQPADGHTLVIG